MVKKRGKKNRGGGGGKILLESAVDSDPEMGTGKKFQSWMNPMDEAEDQEERQLQKKLQRKNPRGKRADDANAREMFAISDSDSEYEVPTMKSIIKKRKEEEEVEEEAKAFSDSDIDDGQGHGGGTNPEDVIGGDAWGKRKKYFYGGNPNDPHFKDKNRVDDDSDLDEAELEAKESQKLQMKQMEQLDDDDFFDTFAEKPQKSKKKKIGKDQQEKILLDVSKLSKREKMKLFAQESPEFEGIVGDFDEKMEEARKLQPVVAMITDGKIPAGPAADLIKTKYQIILNYCSNICCYLMFKAKRTPLKVHPLTGGLVQYKQLLDQLDPISDSVIKQVEDITNKVNQGASIESLVKKAKKRAALELKKNSSKRLRILDPKDSSAEVQTTEKPNSNSGQFGDSGLTADEHIALELYNSLRKKKNLPGEEDEEDESGEEAAVGEDAENPTAEGEDGEEEDSRRSITYQIKKNKGLAPKRSKLQRNPRVKHRVKFEKAKVRRKGQVREVRTEVKKYGGELFGINARVKKGVKLA